MNAIRQFSRVALLSIAFANASRVSGATPTVPDQRDRQVLESLLLHLLADSEFDMTRASTKTATIVLDTRTPEKTGSLMSQQIRSEIEGRSLPRDAEADLRRRNTPPDAKPDTYDAVAASYAKLKFAAGIVVADLSDKGRVLRSGAFEDAYPKARGWLRAYLPGYSSDGTRAVVRARVGPWPHGASVTALLEKRGDKWVVKWYRIARYA